AAEHAAEHKRLNPQKVTHGFSAAERQEICRTAPDDIIARRAVMPAPATSSPGSPSACATPQETSTFHDMPALLDIAGLVLGISFEPPCGGHPPKGKFPTGGAAR